MFSRRPPSTPVIAWISPTAPGPAATCSAPGDFAAGCSLGYPGHHVRVAKIPRLLRVPPSRPLPIEAPRRKPGGLRAVGPSRSPGARANVSPPSALVGRQTRFGLASESSPTHASRGDCGPLGLPGPREPEPTCHHPRLLSGDKPASGLHPNPHLRTQAGGTAGRWAFPVPGSPSQRVTTLGSCRETNPLRACIRILTYAREPGGLRAVGPSRPPEARANVSPPSALVGRQTRFGLAPESSPTHASRGDCGPLGLPGPRKPEIRFRGRGAPTRARPPRRSCRSCGPGSRAARA